MALLNAKFVKMPFLPRTGSNSRLASKTAVWRLQKRNRHLNPEAFKQIRGDF
jgi:hypothetical protein